MPAKRSPNCPAHDLDEAIEKVGAIYAVEGRNSFSGARAVSRMGYNGLNGASRRALGAVRGFGLIEGRGAELRVSDDAVLIIADTEAMDQTDRQDALLRCLRHNRVFCDLYDRYGQGGASHEISAYLQKRYHFKPVAADRTSSVFRNSLKLVAVAAADGADGNETSLSRLQRTVSAARERDLIRASQSAQQPGSEGQMRVSPEQPTDMESGAMEGIGSRSVPGSIVKSNRQDSFMLDQGVVVLSWPARMSPEEFEDFTDWLLLEHRKISRRVDGGTELILTRQKLPTGDQPTASTEHEEDPRQ